MADACASPRLDLTEYGVHTSIMAFGSKWQLKLTNNLVHQNWLYCFSNANAGKLEKITVFNIISMLTVDMQ